MPQPARSVRLKAEGVAIPGEATLTDPGPTPAMASILNYGLVSASVNENGYWTAHIVHVAKAGGFVGPVDCEVIEDGDDLEVEIIADPEPGRHLVIVFEGLAGGGATREMVVNVLSQALETDAMAMWWSRENPYLENRKPGHVFNDDPDAVMMAARLVQPRQVSF